MVSSCGDIDGLAVCSQLMQVHGLGPWRMFDTRIHVLKLKSCTFKRLKYEKLCCLVLHNFLVFTCVAYIQF